jgi:signal transduction histidine kinase
MKIGTKERLVNGAGLTAIGLLVAMVWYEHSVIENVLDQRAVTIELVRGLSELRLLTFEYLLYPTERARLQRGTIANRVDGLIARGRSPGPAQAKIFTELEVDAAADRRLFAELVAVNDTSISDARLDEVTRRFANQLIGKLLNYQQESMTAVLLLNDIATGRVVEVQRQVMVATLLGLALIAAMMVGASRSLHRYVLEPVAAIESATRQVAAGNLDFTLGIPGNDEIGELSRNFNAMTRSLRESFAQIGRSNQDLETLNGELKAFSYSVSHDLRGPLRSMDGFSLVLLEDYGDKLDEEGKDALHRIRAASQRMGGLIDDLLRLSQVTRADLNIVPVDLSKMARQIADDVDEERSGRVVKWIIEPALSVRADPALMRIAMQNLLQNAWKFTGKTEHAVIRVGAMEGDAKTTIFVGDNGVGFDMAHSEGLFGAFQRLHHTSDFAGTGIGLAIVRRIMRRHHGDIWAEAAPDMGATFFFNVNELGNISYEQDHPAG